MLVSIRSMAMLPICLRLCLPLIVLFSPSSSPFVSGAVSTKSASDAYEVLHGNVMTWNTTTVVSFLEAVGFPASILSACLEKSLTGHLMISLRTEEELGELGITSSIEKARWHNMRDKLEETVRTPSNRKGDAPGDLDLGSVRYLNVGAFHRALALATFLPHLAVLLYRESLEKHLQIFSTQQAHAPFYVPSAVLIPEMVVARHWYVLVFKEEKRVKELCAALSRCVYCRHSMERYMQECSAHSG